MDDYKKIVEMLIKRGANPKLFEMPAIAERLKNDIKSKSELESVPFLLKVNDDGTFNFGEYRMMRSDYPQKDSTNLSLSWIADNKRNEVIINEYGVEIIKYTTFDTGAIYDNATIITERADNGEIVCKPLVNSVWQSRIHYFDNGDWKIDPTDELTGNVDRKELIKTYEENVKKITEQYPLAIEYYESIKDQVMETLYMETNSKYQKLKEENQKLQVMLRKSLTFAENIRKSKIGKIFFNKQVKALLGEKYDVANLPTIEEDEK